MPKQKKSQFKHLRLSILISLIVITTGLIIMTSAVVTPAIKDSIEQVQ